jgi:hypothetical protein
MEPTDIGVSPTFVAEPPQIPLAGGALAKIFIKMFRERMPSI